MPRAKVKLQFMVNNTAARKIAFRNRKKVIFKKARELSTLCGIKVCVIIYNPYNNDPEVWPSELGVEELVAQFKEMPEAEQEKLKVDHAEYLRQQIVKTSEQLRKQKKANRENEIMYVMNQILAGNDEILKNLNMADLNDLGWMIDLNLNDIQHRKEVFEEFTV